MALVDSSGFKAFLAGAGENDGKLRKPKSEPRAKAVDGEAEVRNRAEMIKNDPKYAEWLDPDRSDADSLPEGMSDLDKKAVRYLRKSK